MRTAALVCLLLVAMACLASASAITSSSDGVLLQRDGKPRRLLGLTRPVPSAPSTLNADSTSRRKLSSVSSGYVTWDIEDCDIFSGRSVQCYNDYAASCCDTEACSSNPNGSGGRCPSDTLLGCCGKKKK